MKSPKQFTDFYNELRASAFNRDYYQVDMSFDALLETVLRYLDRDAAKALSANVITPLQAGDIILKSVPDFQRDNDKWSPVMQEQYVRNVLRGMRGSPIMLSRIGKVGAGPCNIIDGLQRLTALVRFFTDPDMPITNSKNEVFTASEILGSEVMSKYLWNISVPLRIYTFYNEAEVVRFYIEMNENITHSADDIAKAKAYLASLVSEGS